MLARTLTSSPSVAVLRGLLLLGGCCRSSSVVHAQLLADSSSCPVGGDVSIVAMAGTSVGTEQVVDNSEPRSLFGPPRFPIQGTPSQFSSQNKELTRTFHVVTMYVTTPNASLGTVAPVTDTAVLYLTDVFGINLTENRLCVFNPLVGQNPAPPPPS